MHFLNKKWRNIASHKDIHLAKANTQTDWQLTHTTSSDETQHFVVYQCSIKCQMGINRQSINIFINKINMTKAVEAAACKSETRTIPTIELWTNTATKHGHVAYEFYQRLHKGKVHKIVKKCQRLSIINHTFTAQMNKMQLTESI
jgi:hypothetical protein